MPEDKKHVARKPSPQELPMPKYDYQKSQGGSVSSRYKDNDAKKGDLSPQLRNLHFG